MFDTAIFLTKCYIFNHISEKNHVSYLELKQVMQKTKKREYGFIENCLGLLYFKSKIFMTYWSQIINIVCTCLGLFQEGDL